MGRLSDADADNLLDAKFSGAALWRPATWHVALSYAAPADDGTGYTEPDPALGYGRSTIGSDTASWNPAAGRIKTNAATVTFPYATASWGVIPYFVLLDSATIAAGRVTGWGSIGNLIVDSGGRPVLGPGTMRLRVP